MSSNPPTILTDARAATPKPPRLRLEALDGIRGLAALYVVLYHIGALLEPIFQTLSKPWRLLLRATEHGHDSVLTFIVLSGFVLMLPVARSKNGTFPNGLGDYLRRRAKRILPPYFAALIAALLLGAIWSVVFAGHNFVGNANRPNNPFFDHLTPGVVISHFLVIHNFYSPWALGIDSPMWSVAVESQIYLLLPLILLPVWRRLGMPAAVVAGFVVGLIPVWLLPHGTNFDTSCPWFVGIFAIGSAAAYYATRESLHPLLNKPHIWFWFAVVFLIGVVGTQGGLPRIWNRLDLWQKDLATALSIGCFLVFLARSQLLLPHDRQPVSAQLLSSKACVLLGSFSYSLYLVHYPMVLVCDSILPSHFSPKMHIVALFALAMPVAVISGYLFYLPFERDGLVGKWAVNAWSGAGRLFSSASSSIQDNDVELEDQSAIAR